MKKKLVMAAALTLLSLCGCANSAKTIEGNVAVKETGTEAEAEEAAAKPAAAETPAQSGEEASGAGYSFVYQDVTIEIDADAAPITAQLGEPVSYFEAPSCAFQGVDKIYTYNSFELDTYPTDGKDYVSSVVFKDDTITTAEGVGIGDSAERMEEVYGTGWTDQNGMKVYEQGGMKLCFIFRGDTILSIEYRSKVLDAQN